MTATTARPTSPTRAPRSWLGSLVRHVVSIAVALAASAAIVAWSGGSAAGVADALIDGAFTTPGAWGATLGAAAPLLLVASGAALAARAGVVNIGQEGQLVAGAMAAAFVATHAGSGRVVLVGALAAAVLGGALWAGIAAALRTLGGVPEVLSSLLLVPIAGFVLNHALSRPSLLRDATPGTTQQLDTGVQLDPSTRLPELAVAGNRIGAGVLLAVVTAAVAWFALERTVWGLRVRALGFNPRTAHRAGVRATALGALVLVVSGAGAGLGGGVLLAGVPDHRMTLDFSRGYGWDGLLVALLARNRPLVAIPVAVVFAALRTGSLYLAATGVQATVVDVVKGLLVLALFVPPAIAYLERRRVAPAEAAA